MVLLFIETTWLTLRDNKEKMWAHRFLAMPKTIAAGCPGRCPDGVVGGKALEKKFFRLKRWEYRVQNISNHSVVTLNYVILTFSTITLLSLQNRCLTIKVRAAICLS